MSAQCPSSQGCLLLLSSIFGFFLEVWECASRLLTQGTTLAKLRNQTGLLDSIAISISLDSKCVASVAHRPQVCERALTMRDSAFSLLTIGILPTVIFCYGVTARKFRKAPLLPSLQYGPSVQRCMYLCPCD